MMLNEFFNSVEFVCDGCEAHFNGSGAVYNDRDFESKVWLKGGAYLCESCVPDDCSV